MKNKDQKLLEEAYTNMYQKNERVKIISINPDLEEDYNVGYVDLKNPSLDSAEMKIDENPNFDDAEKTFFEDHVTYGIYPKEIKFSIGLPTPDGQTIVTSIAQMLIDILNNDQVKSVQHLQQLIKNYIS